MAIQTKANPTPLALGTLYSTLQLKVFKVTPTTALTGASLSSTLQRVAEEFGTTAALFQAKSDGTSFVFIGDGHALDTDIVDRRVERVLGETVTTAELSSFYSIS